MNWKKYTLAVVALSTMALAGCGNSAGTTSPSPNTPSNQATNATSADAKTGVATMIGDLGQLQQQVNTGDAAAAKSTGEHLESTWSSFEDGVKAKYKDDYETVEQYLDPLVAASAASPLDKTSITSLSNSLESALKSLRSKLG